MQMIKSENRNLGVMAVKGIFIPSNQAGPSYPICLPEYTTLDIEML